MLMGGLTKLWDVSLINNITKEYIHFHFWVFSHVTLFWGKENFEDSCIYLSDNYYNVATSLLINHIGKLRQQQKKKSVPS